MKTIIILFLSLLVAVPSVRSQWVPVQSTSFSNLKSIHLKSAQSSYVVGDTFALLYSTNNGQVWFHVPSPQLEWNKVFFLPNSTRGWVAGPNGLYKSTNGGTIWIQLLDSENVEDVYFSDTLTGFATGYLNRIKKTVNGGSNFNFVAFNSTGFKRSRRIISAGVSTMYLLATNLSNDSSFIYKSTNKGSNWSNVLIHEGKLNAMDSGDSLHVVACGDDNLIRKTTNGGNNWTQIVIGGINDLLDVKFIDQTNAYICGTNGKIVKTTNAGSLWSSPQVTGTIADLYSIDFYSLDSGIVCGSSGTILVTGNGGITSVIPNVGALPDKYNLSQNYPNPFNPETKIEFNILKEGFVQLKVYDLLGREVTQLVNENISPGNYSVNFNASALPGGIYFYRIKANEYIETKKMILVK